MITDHSIDNVQMPPYSETNNLDASDHACHNPGDLYAPVEQMRDHTEDFIELIRRCSTDLPRDVEETIKRFMKNEEDSSTAQSILRQILSNCEMARERSMPICQDTGTNVYWIDYPESLREQGILSQIIDATKTATKKMYLRPNSVDSITGKNTGDNTGTGHPSVHFRQWDEDYLRVRLMLKGGGSENCGVQYKLPDSRLNAGRDLDGVAECVRDAAFQAQGKGCAPGVLGVCIGGDRSSSYEYSKLTLMEKLGKRNSNAEFDRLEKKLIEEINSTGIGPMGLGGKTTVLDVKITAANRVPACYFVSVTYMCWACRRHSMIIRNGVVSFE